jgi:hypothetical protein
MSAFYVYGGEISETYSKREENNVYVVRLRARLIEEFTAESSNIWRVYCKCEDFFV